jgi:hypothetical protein
VNNPGSILSWIPIGKFPAILDNHFERRSL